MKAKIGVFDSGVGGLTVLKALESEIDADYYYYGDSLNAPYGGKTDDEIYALTRRALDVFLLLHVDLVVIACNTVTAVCIDEVRRCYPFPIVGTEPAVSLGVRSGLKCLLLATEATLRAKRIKRLLEGFPPIETFSPTWLVPEIERVPFRLNEIDLSFLDPYRGYALILGCTHYIWLKPRLITSFEVFDGNEGIVKRVRYLLSNLEGRVGRFREKAGNHNHHFGGIPNHHSKMLKTNKNRTIIFIGSGYNAVFDRYKQMFVTEKD